MMFKCVAVLSLAVLPLAAQTTAPTRLPNKPVPARRKAAVERQPKTSAALALKPTIIAPITPEQMPPAVPRVAYRNNILSVDSENSTLGAILSGIRQQTGAQIDDPPTGSNARVAAHLSGTSRQVLTSLLDGSGLGYAIVGAPDDPERVQKVLLTVQAQNQGQPAGIGMAPSPQRQTPPAEDDPYADLSPSDDGPSPEQMNERLAPGQRQAESQQGGQQGRTPQQYLEQLQKLRNQNPR